MSYTKKSLLAIIMSFIMTITVVIPISPFADELRSLDGIFENYVSEDETVSKSSFMMQGTMFTLKSVATSNGSITFYEYHNGVLVRRGVIYHNQNDRMYITTFMPTLARDGEVIETVEEIMMFPNSNAAIEILETEITPFMPPVLNGGSGISGRLMGTVVFQAPPGWGGMSERVRVTYAESLSPQRSTHTWRDTSTTLTGWAGWISTALGFPALNLSPKITAVLWAGGVVLQGIDQFVLRGSMTLFGYRTHVHFNTINLSTLRTGRFSLYRYVVRVALQTADGQEVWEDVTFWPGLQNGPLETPWGNFRFGEEIRFHGIEALFGWTLVSWWG